MHRGPSTEHRGPSTEHRGPSTEHRGPQRAFHGAQRAFHGAQRAFHGAQRAFPGVQKRFREALRLRAEASRQACAPKNRPPSLWNEENARQLMLSRLKACKERPINEIPFMPARLKDSGKPRQAKNSPSPHFYLSPDHKGSPPPQSAPPREPRCASGMMQQRPGASKRRTSSAQGETLGPPGVIACPSLPEPQRGDPRRLVTFSGHRGSGVEGRPFRTRFPVGVGCFVIPGLRPGLRRTASSMLLKTGKVQRHHPGDASPLKALDFPATAADQPPPRRLVTTEPLFSGC